MPRPPYRERDIIGQQRVFRYVRKLVRGALLKARILGILLFGPPGSGKTKIAALLAVEAGGQLFRLIGSRELVPGLLCQILREAKAGDTVFIDEAHACPPATQEVLYAFIDSQEIPRIDSAGRLDPSQRDRVNRVNLILATTWPSKILTPLHSRLEQVRLAPYKLDELKQMVLDEAEVCEVSLSPQAARVMAERCQGSPRSAKQMVNILSIARPEARCFVQGDVEAWLRERGVSRHGLGQIQIEYLQRLAESPGQKSTIERLVARLRGVDQLFVRREVEPFLLELGAILIDTSRHRVLTERGAQILAEIEAEAE